MKSNTLLNFYAFRKFYVIRLTQMTIQEQQSNYSHFYHDTSQEIFDLP